MQERFICKYSSICQRCRSLGGLCGTRPSWAPFLHSLYLVRGTCWLEAGRLAPPPCSPTAPRKKADLPSLHVLLKLRCSQQTHPNPRLPHGSAKTRRHTQSTESMPFECLALWPVLLDLTGLKQLERDFVAGYHPQTTAQKAD